MPPWRGGIGFALRCVAEGSRDRLGIAAQAIDDAVRRRRPEGLARVGADHDVGGLGERLDARHRVLQEITDARRLIGGERSAMMRTLTRLREA